MFRPEDYLNWSKNVVLRNKWNVVVFARNLSRFPTHYLPSRSYMSNPSCFIALTTPCQYALLCCDISCSLAFRLRSADSCQRRTLRHREYSLSWWRSTKFRTHIVRHEWSSVQLLRLYDFRQQQTGREGIRDGMLSKAVKIHAFLPSRRTLYWITN
jgi:hypothetical protein